MLVNRLWPLLLSTIVAGVLGLVAPQIPGIAAGFAVIWALAWRRQESAVAAKGGLTEQAGSNPPHRRTAGNSPVSRSWLTAWSISCSLVSGSARRNCHARSRRSLRISST